MLTNIGAPGLIIIVVIALIIFGPNKLPELGRAVGRTLGEFKHATKETPDDNYGEKKSQPVKADLKEETIIEAEVTETTDEQKV